MSIFTELKQKLSQEWQAIKAGQGIVEVRLELTQSLDENQLLAWLKAQSHFPQGFWQERDQAVCFAFVGAVKTFEQLDEAQQFSTTYPFQLFGGVKFEGQCCFILPRLLFVKNQQNLTACFYVNTEQLAQEWQNCQAILQQAELATLNWQPSDIISRTAQSDFSQWQTQIEQALRAIAQQQFRKVVLANATTLEFTQPISAYDLLARSRQKNQGCYHFLWAENNETTFIGSSPERLYLREERQFHTEALAGTVAVTNDQAETERNGLWLLNDPKNTYENQLVVDDISAHLADCVEQIKINSAEIKRLHNVQHLRRRIEAKLKPNIHDMECLERIQPTAAVAGLPRLPARKFIAETEGFQRGWYAGALGYLGQNKAEFCVALRSAKIQQNRITLYAGAGIVKGSTAQSEWHEIERKALAMATLLIEA